MQLRFPDPDYASSRRAQSSFWLAVKLSFGLILLLWIIHALQALSPLNLTGLGLRPRDVSGLSGLLFTPLLHGSFEHLVSNSMPLFIGSVALLFLYPNSALRVFPLLYIGTSALAWVFARPSIHIGASGLVYGILTYVFIAGILRRDVRSVGVSLMVWFLYGSMVWGVFPVAPRLSWELHATGLVLGAVLAVIYRNWDRPPVKTYDWELESEDDHEPPRDENDDDDNEPPWRQPRLH
ncbi:MAG: rhomboid family intramembrane serine protease [Wenzhouxiangella sp.]